MRSSVLLAAVCVATSAGAAERPTGFAPSSREAEARAERVFLATPTPEKARRWLAALTEEPHVAGTLPQKKVTDYVRDRFKEFGLSTEVVHYEVFLNYPKSVSLRLVEPIEMPLSLQEDTYDRDKDAVRRDVFPAFHGYSASGKAEGQVLYVNYGTHEDFERLKKLGFSPEGRIVLVRYGAVFRGLKVKEAQERGALGVLIFSDPADDGYMKGDVYPDGPMRPPSAIQRGSVQFLSLGPGDPSTPGYASTPGATRVPREKMEGIPKIPSLPISYAEAEKILRRMGGLRVPDEWQGGLPFAYHIGPGGAAVAMDVQMEDGLRPIYDVIARIPGSVEPDKWVILGNHRDAWVHGAVDPNSGTAALLEMARGLSAARAAGWNPRRTLVLASWDAEEYGLLGSTEWGEEHAEELKSRAVAYVNLDAAVQGTDLNVGGVPSLRDLVWEAALDVPEPRKGGSLAAEWERRARTEWAQRGPVELAGQPGFELRLNPLGSGSDYTVFLDHLGIPSMDFTFAGPYGVYHSVYDDFRWMSTAGDPEFVYHQAAARLMGLLAMRLSSADIVPLRFGPYARSLRQDLDALRREAIRKARAVPEPGEKPALSPDFSPLLTALEDFGTAGTQADSAIEAALEKGPTNLAALNDAATQVERAFLSPQGLPRRPWFQHLLFAPGMTTGYAAWPFPGLAQAIEDRDPKLFDAELQRALNAVKAASERLRALARLAGRT